VRSGRQAVEEKEEKRKDEKKRGETRKKQGLTFGLQKEEKKVQKTKRKRGDRNRERRKEKGERSLSLDTRGEKAEALSISSQVIFGIQNKRGFADSGGLKEPGSPADQVSRVSTLPVFCILHVKTLCIISLHLLLFK
jgi:hypothetical protein